MARSLGTFGPGYHGGTRAFGINEAGVVVGEGHKDDYAVRGPVRAFRWDPATGQLTDLGTTGGDRSSAAAVDAAGIPVGTSTNDGGDERAVRFDP
jgi:probable HAF family extracellular repeat protein